MSISGNISRESVERAINICHNAIVITNPKAEIVWVNDSACKITGYSKEELIGQNPRILKSGETKQEVYESMWDTLIKGAAWQGQLVNKRKDGSLYTEIMTITPIMDDDGLTEFYIAIQHDITDIKGLLQDVAEKAKHLRLALASAYNKF